MIAAVGAQDIVQRCYNRDDANPTFDPNNSWCQQFERDQSNGGVIELKQLQQNQAFINTSGIDFTVNYGVPIGETAGDLGFQWVTTWTEKYETQTTSVDPVFDYVGTIGSTTGSSVPEWKSSLVTTWSRDAWQVSATARYIDSMVHANTVTGGSPLSNTGVPSTTYLDLGLKFDVTENLSVRGSIINVTDQEPRLYSPNVQANTDPSLYDVLGRSFFVGINFRL